LSPLVDGRLPTAGPGVVRIGCTGRAAASPVTKPPPRLRPAAICRRLLADQPKPADQRATARHEETLMDKLLTVHDPRGYPPKVTSKRLATRPESLDGKLVYLVDCLFDNSEAFMGQLRQWFAEHLPQVVIRVVTPHESWQDDPRMRAQIVADGAAAILGVGL
jgi:hypothetical protein